MLSFRLFRWFLLRFAERNLCALLFHEPPRRTAMGWPGPARTQANAGAATVAEKLLGVETS